MATFRVPGCQNDGLTKSGTGSFIAVGYSYGNSGHQRVKRIYLSRHYLAKLAVAERKGRNVCVRTFAHKDLASSMIIVFKRPNLLCIKISVLAKLCTPCLKKQAKLFLL